MVMELALHVEEAVMNEALLLETQMVSVLQLLLHFDVEQTTSLLFDPT